MTILPIAEDKIKITLTHTEVIACFGEYEQLVALTPKVKLSLNLLLNEAIVDKKLFSDNCKISAQIRVIKSVGCEILLTAIKLKKKKLYQNCLFKFSDSDNLTKGILRLYKNTDLPIFDSELYKYNEEYHLIISGENLKENLFFLNEYSSFISEEVTDIEYTREYAKPIIMSNAIKKYGCAFKDFS